MLARVFIRSAENTINRYYFRHDCLVVDAGIRHQNAERFECVYRPAFELEHPGLLL
jgi:hypothetical protein